MSNKVHISIRAFVNILSVALQVLDTEPKRRILMSTLSRRPSFLRLLVSGKALSCVLALMWGVLKVDELLHYTEFGRKMEEVIDSYLKVP